MSRVHYKVDRAALLKILLHAAKHPAAPVNGVLLGEEKKRTPPGDAAAADGDAPPPAPQTVVQVHDVVPLFHSYLTLAPCLEAALFQVDAYARSQSGGRLQVVGYYQANERLGDTELGAAGRKVADRIQQRYPLACVLLVDNSKLESFYRQKQTQVLELLTREGTRGWMKASAPGGAGTGALAADGAGVGAVFLEMHGEGRHKRLADWDDHLADISKDWLNPELLQ